MVFSPFSRCVLVTANQVDNGNGLLLSPLLWTDVRDVVGSSKYETKRPGNRKGKPSVLRVLRSSAKASADSTGFDCDAQHRTETESRPEPHFQSNWKINLGRTVELRGH